MSLGTIATVINSARLKISRGTVEVTLASNVTLRKTRVIDRINTRAGPVDSVRWELVEVEFTAALTKALLAQIKTDSSISSASKITYTSWTVKGLNISGTAGDDLTDTVSATVIDYDELGPENGIAQARIKLRVAPAAS